MSNSLFKMQKKSNKDWPKNESSVGLNTFKPLFVPFLKDLQLVRMMTMRTVNLKSG